MFSVQAIADAVKRVKDAVARVKHVDAWDSAVDMQLLTLPIARSMIADADKLDPEVTPEQEAILASAMSELKLTVAAARISSADSGTNLNKFGMQDVLTIISASLRCLEDWRARRQKASQ